MDMLTANFRLTLANRYRRSPNSEIVQECRPVIVARTAKAEEVVANPPKEIFGPLFTGGNGTANISEEFVPALRLVSITENQAEKLLTQLETLCEQNTATTKTTAKMA